MSRTPESSPDDIISSIDRGTNNSLTEKHTTEKIHLI